MGLAMSSIPRVSTEALPLECLYRWEKERADCIFLTQPFAGQMRDWTWAQAASEVRHMAAWLKGAELGARYPRGHPLEELRLVDHGRPCHLDGRLCQRPDLPFPDGAVDAARSWSIARRKPAFSAPLTSGKPPQPAFPTASPAFAFRPRLPAMRPAWDDSDCRYAATRREPGPSTGTSWPPSSIRRALRARRKGVMHSFAAFGFRRQRRWPSLIELNCRRSACSPICRWRISWNGRAWRAPRSTLGYRIFFSEGHRYLPRRPAPRAPHASSSPCRGCC